MALALPPQRLSLRDLEDLLLENQRQQGNIIMAIAAVRRRRRLREENQRQARRWWVKPWVGRRQMQGQYYNLFEELDRETLMDYKGYLRMDRDLFAEVLHRVGPRITKNNRCRTPLEPGHKLVITLRYLATGDAYRSMRWDFRVPHNTISILVRAVCMAIIEEFRVEVFTMPSTPDEWRVVADGFANRWNFQHCVGAIDGKHIALKKPKKSGSVYYNYKGFYSIVLMAAVDSDYRFIWATMGYPGCSSDAGIFKRSPLRRGLENRTLGLPRAEPLRGDNKPMPYFFVGDDAFPLQRWMMKPYPQRHLTPEERIYNYRHSRARRVSENAFGILANRWRCLLTTMQQHPKTVTTITKACLTLHNIIRIRHPQININEVDREDANGNVRPGAWREGRVLSDNANLVGNQSQKRAKRQRNYLKDYYNSPFAALPWQDRIVRPQRVEPESNDSDDSDTD